MRKLFVVGSEYTLKTIIKAKNIVINLGTRAAIDLKNIREVQCLKITKNGGQLEVYRDVAEVKKAAVAYIEGPATINAEWLIYDGSFYGGGELSGIITVYAEESFS